MESINERFDSAIEYMAPGTFIFGDVIRNLISGIEPGNILTMLAGTSEFKTLSYAFGKSSKWLKTNNFNLICNIATVYVNMYGAKVHLIRVEKPSVTPYNLIDYACNLRCNCLAMDHNGVVLEIVAGAYKDCQDKVLNLAGDIMPNNIDVLEHSIRLRRQEGWVNNIPRKQLVRKPSRAKPVKPVNKSAPTVSASKQRVSAPPPLMKNWFANLETR
jgi:hypothetical protein